MEFEAARARADPPPSGMPPDLNLAPRDIELLADELVAYHALFAPLFHRREQRHWALKYFQGQLLDLERKSVEPMARALEGGNVQAMQQFVSVGAWDDEAILKLHQRLVAETLGDSDTGVLVIDSTEFPKQGKDSAGVAPQYCGLLGKVANCQSAVVACYASALGYTLIDRRLYLPDRWSTDAYKERRQKCGIPSDVQFQTKAEQAGELITTLRERQALPFRWVTFDEHFGRNPSLLDRIDDLGVCYLAEVQHDTRVWLTRPATEVPPSKGKGRHPSRERLVAGEPAPIPANRLAEQLPAEQWTRHQIKEGAKGPLVAEFAFLRGVAVRDDRPGPDVWVVFRRSVGEKPGLKVYLSNASTETPPAEFVRVSAVRWPVESAILECKDELGMDHYEVRGWVGWHHHLALSFLAHHFLVRMRLRFGPKGGGFNRAPGPSPAHRGVTASAPGHPGGPRAGRRDPASELRGLPVASSSHHPEARLVVGCVG